MTVLLPSSSPPLAYKLRIACVVAVVVACLLFVPQVEPPRSWLLFALTLLAIAGGAHFLVRGHPGYRFHPRPLVTVPYWIGPLVMAVVGGLFTLNVLGGWHVYLGMAGTGVAVAVLVYVQTLFADPTRPAPSLAHLVASLGAYFTALLLFLALQTSALDPGLATLAAGVTSALLALELFRDGEMLDRQAVLYAAIVGVLIVEIGAVVQLLALGEIVSGLSLMLTFYFLVGIVHGYLRNNLSPMVVLEFVAIAAVGFAVLFWIQTAGGRWAGL